MNAQATKPFTFVNRGRKAQPVIIGLQHDRINLSIYRVTPMADGMELVEYLGASGYNAPADADRLVGQAKTMAQVTGSKSATYTEEGPGGTVAATATWFRSKYDREAPSLVQGTHRARATMDPAQAALRAEMAANPAQPKSGDRYVVAELSGYKLVQNRPLDHRSCHCGDGVTTYSAGTVEEVIYWADNSVDVKVRLESGRLATVQTVAPHGDACF